MFKECSAIRLGIFCLCGGLSLLPAAPAQAQDSPLNSVLQGAGGDFNAGDYQKAAGELESVLQSASDSPELEPVYYMLGSAYFNLEDYKKAIEVFTKYKKKFPQGARLVPVSLSLGQSYMLSKQPALAAVEFAQLAKISPQFREEALLFQAQSLKEQDKPDEAIPPLEQLLEKGVSSTLSAKAALMLAPIYIEKDEGQKALGLLQDLQKNLNLVENIVQFNAVAIKLGDGFLEQKMFEEALTSYRMVPFKEEVVKLQTARIEKMQDEVTRNMDAIHANPKAALDIIPINNRVVSDMDQAKSLLAEFQKLPVYAPTLYLRMGRALYELNKKWESIVAFGEVMRKYPQSAEAEPSLFEMVVAFVDVQRSEEAKKYGTEYLRDFPAGPNADTVGYLMGAVAMNLEDYEGAEATFTKILATRPKSTFREDMMYMVGMCKFALSDYDGASTALKSYLSEFPSGVHDEDAEYHVAVGILFNGKPDDALGPLQQFLRKFPGGTYAADARYRVGVCLSSQQKYDEVLALCQKWQKDFPDNPELPEVLSLQGDALSGLDRTDEAIDSFTRASKIAKNLQTQKYSLFDGAVKLLQKKRDWEALSTLLEDFAKNNPDNPLVISAYYEIGKARVREDKAEEAKVFLADAVKKYTSDPARSDVERILTLLVQLCVKKPHAVAVADGETPAPSPTPGPDPQEELARLLAGPNAPSGPTARARVLFAQAQLAGLQKKPLLEEQNFKSIADLFKPADLSPTILAQTADYLVQVGSYKKAAAFYQEIEKTYPSSEDIDSARVGLGEIAYREHEYPVALDQFSQAVDKSTSAAKLKDATIGKAKTLLAMNKLEDAKKLFQQVAAVREWRGPATAESVYSLGQIAGKEGKLPEAIAFYQRVYVAYQRYLPWVAKAYLSSGLVFEQMKKIPEAINTYNEMLRNDKLSTFPETEEARQRLQNLGKG